MTKAYQKKTAGLRRFTTALMMSAAVTLPACAQEETTTATEYPNVWDLTDIYTSSDAWQAEYEKAAQGVSELSKFEGTLGDSSGSLLQAYDTASAVYKEVVRLFVYATLKGDEDLREANGQERRSLAQSLLTSYSESIAWAAPELLAVGSERIEGFISEEPGLTKHAFGIRETLRQAPHTLGTEAEGVLASTGNILAGPSTLYDILASAEMPRETITLSDGTEARLDQAGYTKFRAVQNRTDRKAVFDAFWGSWKPYEATLGASLSTHVKGHVFSAKARKYDSALAYALSGSNIPEAVYKTLVAEVNAGLPALHRYFDLRRRILGLEDIHYYDIYPDLVEDPREYSVDDAKRMTLAASVPLGQDYRDKLNEGFSARWMHVLPSEGKATGAYMFGAAYDVHPYLLLNFNNSYDSVSTFAHEWGHAVHTLLSKEAQPWETASYPTFTAEIASVSNEILLQDDSLKNAANDDERLFYLGYALEQMRGTFYRQTMFAEFELAIHEAIENGEALSGERMTEIYLDLLNRYHGAEEGLMAIDPAYAMEWAYIPHFYRNFYVFQYSTSMAGGALLADRILNGEEGASEAYLDILRAGGSDHAYEILRRAGIDMATPAPYRSLVDRMNGIMDEIEVILARRAD